MTKIHLHLRPVARYLVSSRSQSYFAISSCALNSAVVADHGVVNPASPPRHIDETRRYLRDFNASLASASTSLDLYEKMLTLHPIALIQARYGRGGENCETVPLFISRTDVSKECNV